jgi:hypothetical protein
MPDEPSEVRAAGLRALRRYHEGALAWFERRADVRFVVEASTGRLVMPLEPALAKAGSEEMVLWMPSESAWAAHAAVLPAPIERPEACEAVDRWAAYHGRTSLTAWARCRVDGLKTESFVWGREALESPNPLGRAEYALIKRANSDLPALAIACKRHAATPVAEPLCVGVDPYGLDVRARFGVLRLEFPDGIEARSPDACAAQIDHLLALRGLA